MAFEEKIYPFYNFLIAFYRKATKNVNHNQGYTQIYWTSITDTLKYVELQSEIHSNILNPKKGYTQIYWTPFRDTLKYIENPEMILIDKTWITFNFYNCSQTRKIRFKGIKGFPLSFESLFSTSLFLDFLQLTKCFSKRNK